ncbi:hypothetical protein FOMA001_g9026 [Fusarium oxysporum f. sp. matthiolae]|nr:hypothetical protein FOMA001_g9026 [Fusarium oxysporum f. sp. matthiolae]
MKALVAERLPDGEVNPMMDKLKSPDDLCRVVLVAKEISQDETSEKAYLFRTYDHDSRPNLPKNRRGYHKNPGPAHTCEIWKVGRAISAAPTYFKPMEIDGVKYSDGGIMFNDPSEVVCLEIGVKEGWHDHPPEPYPISLVLTVGTGLRPTKRDRAIGLLAQQKHLRKISNINKRLAGAALSVGPIEERMQQDKDKFGFIYYKWTGGAEVGGLSLDESKPATLDKMHQWITAYMGQPNVQNELKIVAQQLVKRRRERYTLTPDRWRRFTFCTRVRCPFCSEHTNNTEAETFQHLMSEHPTQMADIHPDSYKAFVGNLAKCQPWMRGPW